MDFDFVDKGGMRRSLAVFAIFLCGLASIAGAKKKPLATVRFYAEVAENNGTTFGTEIPLLDGSGSIRISKIATITEQDMVGFTPFQTTDGSIGAYFFLDEHGKLLLETLSMESRGKIIIGLVNGRHVTDLMIDKRISDGIAVIPAGMTPQDIDVLRKSLKLREGKNAAGPSTAPASQTLPE